MDPFESSSLQPYSLFFIVKVPKGWVQGLESRALAQEKEALIERGKAALRSADFTVAADVFRRVMLLDPGDTVVAAAAVSQPASLA
jgi:hypothetical protein